VVLLGFLAVMAVAILKLKDLFAAVMLLGIYSLLCAALFVVMDAVDVAFTEAAVGAGISTILILGTLALTGSKQRARRGSPLAIITVFVTGIALIYGTFDMPRYGDPKAPAYLHVAPRYIHDSGAEIGVPNIVTSVLASYRGYDTLGEVSVIFTAGVAVWGLLGLRRRNSKTKQEK
jgi:multicomponent Na+:H+ antiporter subunit B